MNGQRAMDNNTEKLPGQVWECLPEWKIVEVLRIHQSANGTLTAGCFFDRIQHRTSFTLIQKVKNIPCARLENLLPSSSMNLCLHDGWIAMMGNMKVLIDEKNLMQQVLTRK